MANNRNKCIPEGVELKVSYGSRTNRYLAIWYGFALTENPYDSYSFRLVIDDRVAKGAGLTHGVLVHYISAEELKKGYLTVNGYIIAMELITIQFKAKFSEIHLDLLIFLRGHLYQQWLKDHPSKKKSPYFSISIPFDMSYEIAVLKHFIDIFGALQMSLPRSEMDDQRLLTAEKLSGPKRTIVVAEMGWKKIIAEQIRLGRLLLDIVRRQKADPQTPMKQIYMARVPEVDKSGENPLEVRLKVKEYLKRLLISPTFQYK